MGNHLSLLMDIVWVTESYPKGFGMVDDKLCKDDDDFCTMEVAGKDAYCWSGILRRVQSR